MYQSMMDRGLNGERSPTHPSTVLQKVRNGVVLPDACWNHEQPGVCQYSDYNERGCISIKTSGISHAIELQPVFFLTKSQPLVPSFEH